jgi:hypothetical protein
MVASCGPAVGLADGYKMTSVYSSARPNFRIGIRLWYPKYVYLIHFMSNVGLHNALN